MLLSAAADALSTATAGPAGGVVAALRALGLLAPTGGSVPDAIDHLLHEPAAHVRAVLDTATQRQALVAALRAIAADLGAGGATPDEVTVAIGPIDLTADLATRRLTVAGSATPADAGVVAWSGASRSTRPAPRAARSRSAARARRSPAASSSCSPAGRPRRWSCAATRPAAGRRRSCACGPTPTPARSPARSRAWHPPS